MSALPKISVVTPSLNQGEYLEDAILSVLRQGYPRFEHIVIDGASRDNTIALLRSYPHLCWVSDPDQGQSDAINKGFRMASGDIIAWLNADDYYLPGSLEAIANFALANPRVDIIYGNSIFVDKDGHLKRAKEEHAFDFGVLLYYGCYISSAAAFFRRELVQQGFLLDTHYRICMDYEYFVRLAVSGRIFKHIDRPLGAFRWHGSNRSLEFELGGKERLQVQHKWSKLKLPPIGYATLARVFWAKRVALKILNGGYWGERKARQHAGKLTQWFRRREGFAACVSQPQ